MATCKCPSPAWRISNHRPRKTSRYQLVCLKCESVWWVDDVAGLSSLTEEERKKLKREM